MVFQKMRLALGAAGLFFSLAACSPPEPIKIGLLAGLSDRGSDFGESVRNGVILAVEQQNLAGGINGRKIELLVRDDGQDEAVAIKAAQELIALHPDIIIGPVTSSMATVVLPLMDAAGQVIISPTVASTNFFAKDDNFFRVNCTTHEAATQHAQVIFDRGARHVGLAFDESNLPFSGTWVKSFSAEFKKLGGSTSGTAGFESAASTRFSEVISRLLGTDPDALIFVASTLDTARLAQQARRLAPGLPLSSSEWAASAEALSEMGGSAVENMLITHAYNRDDQSAAYQNFRSAFKGRFQREFGSFSLLAYDTANVVFAAMKQRSAAENMKTALLKYGPYQGVQQEIRFDANGDATRKVHFTELRNENLVQYK
ncbi:MAG: amino acid ABC transporter substrate-binding protein [Betaproteobacteria bacterium HGW-Betaproteobacteria-10]|nr:MAG: amino acid ABC transporter substrate-binding protein [Betaproteobacteria bacterium HGW-Betaproteobacteria-10]